MPDFLILKKTGPGDADVVGCAVIRGKTNDQVEDAIREGSTQGEGTYIAVSLSSATVREAVNTVELREPEGD